MKKLSGLLIVSALLFLSQKIEAQEINFGIKGGANYATFSGDDISNQDAIISYHGGLFTRFTFTKVGAQAELLFSSQGAEVGGNDATLSYLHVPLLGRLNFAAGKLGIYLGPQFGYLLNVDDGVDVPGVDAKDRYNDVEISAVIGAELDVAAGILVGARYYQGLNSIASDYEFTRTTVNPVTGGQITSTVSQDGGDVKNQVVQIYLGYKF